MNMNISLPFIYSALFIIVAFLTLTGCASQIMQAYVGQPIQTVMLDYGPPANAFDMPDKTRVFQWMMNQSYTTPIYVNTYGSATAMGTGNIANGWMNSNSTITGGQTFTSTCVYSLFTKWNKKESTWYVTGFKKPDLSCE